MTNDKNTPAEGLPTSFVELCRLLGINELEGAGARVLEMAMERTASPAGLLGHFAPDGRLLVVAQKGRDWSTLTGGAAEESILYRSESVPSPDRARGGSLAALVAGAGPRIMDPADGDPRFTGLVRVMSIPLELDAGAAGILLLGGCDRSYTPDVFPAGDPLVTLAGVVCRSVIHRARHDAMQADVRQAQVMEMLGRLTGGIAHDFGNVLQLLRSSVEVCIDDLHPQSSVRTDLREMLTVIDRATSLTRQLLSIGRQGKQAVREIDLNQVIAEHEPMMRRLVGGDVVLSTHLAADLGKVKADPGQVQQVVLNLAINARDAMPAGGRLVLRTVNRQLEVPDGAPPGTPREHVMLEVTDSGCGMSREIIQNIFDPYFTTKEAGRGTGLGLANVKVIAERWGGRIHVYSEPGLGTSFKIFLPRSDTPVVAMTDVTAAEAVRKGTILLVEDELPVRMLAKSMLSKAGYDVLEAAGAVEALEAANGGAGTIDLVLTDLVLPGMTGADLALKIQESRPGTKILYMSGFTIHSSFVEGLHLNSDQIIEKPFRRDLLLRRVREMIEG